MESFLNTRIATLTGGSGAILLEGFKKYKFNITAICTSFDSGGSTGRILNEFGSVLRAGDIRKCMSALCGPRAGIMAWLFESRPKHGDHTRGLGGHPAGNILLLNAELELGSRIEAIRQIGRDTLDMQGTVLPISIDDAHVVAELSDGTIIERENVIDERDTLDERSVKRVWLDRPAYICREAAAAIEEADIVVLGPGDLFTSLVPILNVRGLKEALRQSDARVIYNPNLMTKAAETRGYTALDFAQTILDYDIGRDKFDAIIVNSAVVPESIREYYFQSERAEQVSIPPEAEFFSVTDRLILGDFLSEEKLRDNLVRHDSSKLARQIADLVWSWK